MARAGYIYRIIAPGSNSVYVGQSYSPHARFKQHKARPCNPALAHFLRKHPDAEIYFWPVIDMDAGEIEDEAECRALGYNLLNCIPCGSAPPTSLGRVQSVETRTKIREALRGIPKSAEIKAKISATKKGVPLSAETRIKMSAAQKVSSKNAEIRARIRLAQKGKPWSAARRAAEQRGTSYGA
jgi:predicted GIY-YIG superfamily endonuclease